MLVLFGGVTLFMSSSVLFGWFGIRAKEGNFVPFVVWANWLCGVLYLMAVIQIIRRKRFVTLLLSISFIMLIIAFIGFLVYIKSGGVYETKTIGAMLFRMAITAVFLFTSLKIVKK